MERGAGVEVGREVAVTAGRRRGPEAGVAAGGRGTNTTTITASLIVLIKALRSCIYQNE